MELPPLPANSVVVHVAAFRYFASRAVEQQADIVGANLALTDLVYRFALQRGISELRAGEQFRSVSGGMAGAGR